MQSHISRAVAALLLMIAVTACTTHLGGAGRLSDGESVSGTLTASGNGVAIGIVSLNGWTCQSVWDQQKSDKASVTLPMTCSDGKTGTMILAFNQISKEMHGTFRLSDGRTGQITFSAAKG